MSSHLSEDCRSSTSPTPAKPRRPPSEVEGGLEERSSAHDARIHVDLAAYHSQGASSRVCVVAEVLHGPGSTTVVVRSSGHESPRRRTGISGQDRTPREVPRVRGVRQQLRERRGNHQSQYLYRHATTIPESSERGESPRRSRYDGAMQISDDEPRGEK